MENPLVSVILMVYNEKNYIAHALDSMIAQKTSFPFEIICHDDASTDGSQEIILDYQKRYPDLIIPVLQEQNRLQGGTVNTLIRYCYPVAKGKYIAYCDGDDYWTDETKLQKQVDFLESHPDYTMCLHNFAFLYDDSGEEELSDCGKQDRDFSVDEFILWDYKNIPQIGTSLYYKSLAMDRPALFTKIGGGEKSKRLISDQPLFIYLAMQGKVWYFSEAMSVWRRHSHTWAHDGDQSKEIQFLHDKIAFFDALEQNYPQLPKESLDYARGKCKYDIGWLSEDYALAWDNIAYSGVQARKKLFILTAKHCPRLAHKIRARIGKKK